MRDAADEMTQRLFSVGRRRRSPNAWILVCWLFAALTIAVAAGGFLYLWLPTTGGSDAKQAAAQHTSGASAAEQSVGGDSRRNTAPASTHPEVSQPPGTDEPRPATRSEASQGTRKLVGVRAFGLSPVEGSDPSKKPTGTDPRVKR
jgi:hypothetical protein